MEIGKMFYDMDNQSQKLKQTAEKTLLERVNEEKFTTILDIGCGDGHFLHNFPNKKTKGIDYNQSMIEQGENLEGKIEVVDIVRDKKYVEQNKNNFDIITANYVFTELKKEELLFAFKNIYELMHENGGFYFTITNPQTRKDNEFEGYKLKFNEEFEYEKEDTPFEVHLQNEKGEFIDVGIRDFHQPIETYDSLLKEAGFTDVKRKNIDKNHHCSYAILYDVKK